MPDWKAISNRIGINVEARFDQLKNRVEEALDRNKPIQIVPYRGFGTTTRFHLTGRVLEAKTIHEQSDNDRVWQNILAMYQRFETDEVPHAPVRIQHHETKVNLQADHEGYFRATLNVDVERVGEEAWHPVEVELQDSSVRAVGQVLVPSSEATFGVISDMDDTILQTHATSKLKMARLTLLNNAHTRMPFEGVGAFYRALRQGGDGQRQNPVFYVSRSPWNLYDLLTQFMDLHGIPRGPLFLRDLGLDWGQGAHHAEGGHKRYAIGRLMEAYPDLSFILIGDSGQRDPEIYRDIIAEYPGRVLAVYIRDVSLKERDAEVDRIAEDLVDTVPMLRMPNTVKAAEHAAEQGWIDASRLDVIRADQREDATEPDELDRLVESD